jgi:indoleamine 2,3-dioxygenase
MATSEMSFHEEVSGEPVHDQCVLANPLQVRLYMPGPHRKFLANACLKSRIKDFVLSTSTATSPSPKQRRLQQAYQDATRAFGDFRTGHMQMVTRYIIVPSRKTAPSSSGTNLATVSLQSSKGAAAELTGTGGTELIPFLKMTRDETYRAGLAVSTQEHLDHQVT